VAAAAFQTNQTGFVRSKIDQPIGDLSFPRLLRFGEECEAISPI
jgi:hypothetical protein